MASVSLCLPLHAALAHTYTHPWISTASTHKSIFITVCNTHRQARTKKSTSLIQSSVVASDGSLINVATLQLFISVTSNLHSDMIGLMYDALVSCSCLLHSKAKEKNVPLLVNRNLFPCQLYFFPSIVHLKGAVLLNKGRQTALKRTDFV